MYLLPDLLPIIVFFLSYKLWGIYTGIVMAMIATMVQVVYCRLRGKKIYVFHLISVVSFMLLSTATLTTHNLLYIKWKPTLIYWLFSGILLFKHFYDEHQVIKQLMGKAFKLPKQAWIRINMSWVVFFLSMGFLNLYAVYHFSTNGWVHFKLFGTLCLTLVFVLLQALYMIKHGLRKEDLK